MEYPAKIKIAIWNAGYKLKSVHQHVASKYANTTITIWMYRYKLKSVLQHVATKYTNTNMGSSVASNLRFYK